MSRPELCDPIHQSSALGHWLSHLSQPAKRIKQKTTWQLVILVIEAKDSPYISVYYSFIKVAQNPRVRRSLDV